jgi:hypothetical protein
MIITRDKELMKLQIFFYLICLSISQIVSGCVLNHFDKDGWTAEMAMPIKDLQAFGNKFAQGTDWRIFVGRYNYSRYLQGVELSMTPQLSKTDYHSLDEYAVLELVR